MEENKVLDVQDEQEDDDNGDEEEENKENDSNANGNGKLETVKENEKEEATSSNEKAPETEAVFSSTENGAAQEAIIPNEENNEEDSVSCIYVFLNSLQTHMLIHLCIQQKLCKKKEFMLHIDFSLYSNFDVWCYTLLVIMWEFQSTKVFSC